jgi:hypothetical protein
MSGLGAGEGTLLVTKEFALDQVGGKAAQFTATMHSEARGERSCKVRAAISLPTPVSPVIRTGRSDRAIRARVASTERIAAETPRGPGCADVVGRPGDRRKPPEQGLHLEGFVR